MFERACEEIVGRGEVGLVLVRHGQTAWNVERRFLGCTDLPLDDTGVAQARALGSALGRRFAHVYSSPLSRALATARELHDAPSPVHDLREMAQGDLEGLSREEALARFPTFLSGWVADPVDIPAPGGESLRQCRDRAYAAVVDIARRHSKGDLVAVVTHQMVIASIACTIAQHPLQGWRAHGVPNTALTILGWDGDGFRLVASGLRATPEEGLSPPAR